MTKAELQRVKDRVDRILDNVLVDMQPGWDDSVHGFNKAWDVVRDVLKEEIDRCTTQ